MIYVIFQGAEFTVLQHILNQYKCVADIGGHFGNLGATVCKLDTVTLAIF